LGGHYAHLRPLISAPASLPSTIDQASPTAAQRSRNQRCAGPVFAFASCFPSSFKSSGSCTPANAHSAIVDLGKQRLKYALQSAAEMAELQVACPCFFIHAQRPFTSIISDRTTEHLASGVAVLGVHGTCQCIRGLLSPRRHGSK